jgi:phospholipid/cholesterol/gamma-HCH transport system ATP-binding protein
MIEIKNIHKSFGRNHVLRGVNLNIEKGKTTVIIGPSGCGKSVLLKLIIGLLKPESGNIFVDGTDITSLSDKQLYEIRKKFGFLFQGAALFDSMTVGENVGLGLSENNLKPPEEIKKVVAEKLSLVGLQGTEHLMPSELSGGMKKRVGLARAIAIEPEFILYDEPTTGLDPVMSESIDGLIDDIASKLKVTSIVVTHDIFSVYEVADKVAMIHKGVIHFEGTPRQLEASPDPVVREFLERTRTHRFKEQP